MNSLQVSLCSASANGNRISSPLSWNLRGAIPVSPSRSQCLRWDRGGSQRRRRPPVCLFGGKGAAKEDRDDASPWESLRKVIGNVGKERSVQDVLKEQMEQREFGGDGGSGKPPDDGDAGGGDFDDDPDELPKVHPLVEFIHQFISHIGVVLLYMYLLGGEDLYKVSRDFFLCKWGLREKPTLRLKIANRKWKRFEKLWNKQYKWRDARERWLDGRKGCFIKKVLPDTETWWNPDPDFDPLESSDDDDDDDDYD